MRYSGDGNNNHFGRYRRHTHADSTIKLALIVAVGLLLFTSTGLLVLVNFTDSSTSSAATSVVVEREPSLEHIDVLIPVQEIPAGSLLEPAMFKIDSRPKVGISGQAAKDFEEIKGMYARSLIISGQPISTDYISSARPINAITASIPEGYRAVTINVDAKTGIEGWARAGARVDVTWISTVRGKQSVTVIVENAKIISAARRTEDEQRGPDVLPTELTLLTPIEDANKILLAMQSGSISLSLRGDSDSGKSDAGRTFTVEDLLGGAKPLDDKRNEPTIKVRDNNGQYEDFVFRKGQLVPASEAGNGGNSPLSILNPN